MSSTTKPRQTQAWSIAAFTIVIILVAAMAGLSLYSAFRVPIDVGDSQAESLRVEGKTRLRTTLAE